jgi:galactokinase
MTPAELAAEFQRRYHAVPRIFRAPGRVNLIGEHTDYNDGFVMPVAIDYCTLAAAAPRRDRKVVAHSLTLGATGDFDLDLVQPSGTWLDYVAGTAWALQARGARLTGANLLFASSVPIGAGLSSSAALEVSAALALLAVSGAVVPTLEIARACQRAENETVGVGSGIMDQFVSCHARAGHALLLDCRSLAHEALPLPPGVALVIANTMARHELADGEYNRRRADCEAACRALSIPALRDITPAQLLLRADELTDRVRRRARHVVEENERVLQAAQALREADCRRLGQLMYASHRSLATDYEVSCQELDIMVQLAASIEGVWGARMTGGGFGGATVNLVATEAVPQFCRALAQRYCDRTGIEPAIYVTEATAAAAEVAFQ